MPNRLKALARPALLLVLPTVVGCLVLLELGLRLTGRGPASVTDDIFEPWGQAYRLRPNQETVSHTPSFTCTIRTNARGFRDRASSPRPLARPYDVWLGDSATFANGVEYEDSFVGLVGAAAEARGREVLNLAVGGHHLLEQEQQLEEFLATAPRPPERVIFVFTPQLMALFEHRHHDLVLHGGYLFPRDHWITPYALLLLNKTFASFGFLRDGVRAVQASYFPRGPEVAAEMLAMYARSNPALSPEATRRFEERLDGLDARIRAAGASPVHVYLPTTADLRAPELLGLTGRPPADYDFGHYRDALHRQAARAGVPLLDLDAVLRLELAKGVTLGFAQDMHYNPAGHLAVARVLGPALLGDGVAGSERAVTPVAGAR